MTTHANQAEAALAALAEVHYGKLHTDLVQNAEQRRRAFVRAAKRKTKDWSRQMEAQLGSLKKTLVAHRGELLGIGLVVGAVAAWVFGHQHRRRALAPQRRARQLLKTVKRSF
jgi:hypothetical protein